MRSAEVDLFAVNARLLPATGNVPFAESPVRWLESLVLPVVTLAVVAVTGIAKRPATRCARS